jgi:hypothetical protein
MKSLKRRNSSNKETLQPSVCLASAYTSLLLVKTIQFLYSLPSWSAPVDEPGIKANIPNMIAVKQPSKEPLQPQAIAAMRRTAVLSLVRVPIIRLGIDAHSVVPSH